ncbi:MAG: hypothetical protein ACQESK_06440 [Bacteroidota bacterium]
MKKLAVLIFILFGFLSCSNSKMASENGIKQKTTNPNTPFIYKNGFKNFEIKPVLASKDKDSTYVNELRFNAVLSAKYTQKLMFDEFGKWDKAIRPNNEKHPVLIWENIKLFDDKDKLYNIAANGVENWEEIYASVIVYDSNNSDCLAESNAEKDKILAYFSDGIKNLSSNNKFYEVYRKMIDEYKLNK